MSSGTNVRVEIDDRCVDESLAVLLQNVPFWWLEFHSDTSLPGGRLERAGGVPTA